MPAPELEKEQQEQETASASDPAPPPAPSAEEAVSKPDAEPPLSVPEPTNDAPISSEHDILKDGKDPDEHGDVVVEDEDTVIY